MRYTVLLARVWVVPAQSGLIQGRSAASEACSLRAGYIFGAARWLPPNSSYLLRTLLAPSA